MSGFRGALAAGLWLTAASAGAVLPSSEEMVGADSVTGTFLLRGVGGRPAGMGEAYGAVADDASAGSWNPAGLARVDRPSGMVMYDAAGEGLGLRYAAFGGPVGIGSAAVSLTAMTYGSYDEFDALGNRIGYRSPIDVAGLVGWGWRHPGWFGQTGGIGVAAELVSTAAKQNLVGLNAGVLYQLSSATAVGIAVQHVSTKSRGYALPGLFRFSWTASPLAEVRIAADGVQGLVDRERWVAAGAEARLSAKLAVRAGYRWSGAKTKFGGVSGITGGVGVRLRGIGVDYGYQPIGDLTTSHRISLSYRAGGGKE